MTRNDSANALNYAQKAQRIVPITGFSCLGKSTLIYVYKIDKRKMCILLFSRTHSTTVL